ncbi:ADP-dependent NAD(P)H-hydrate dehydratase [Herbiconiux sp. SYSU D00978]|uniref:ADP-dependent NAD(P)H-hydrate dehydratase n=1 Tax=Herbiconiux sp. SYSU D00978 TaxID=2812562 RepID=UPI001A9643F5|nr:ADP/ATP-dependent (S)-NAD(P)H-hydrate dehydratase [Herbiconiux sp. SYSU D00978]
MDDFTPFDRSHVAAWIVVPRASDDKYRRGVLGVVTGSAMYPGAAVLGVEAALRTGVGMLRYLGPGRAADFVLHRRPEIVTAPGRVQAWLLGSGVDPETRDEPSTKYMTDAFAGELPVVADSGSLDLLDGAVAPVVITPHYRELARLTGQDPADVEADAAGSAARAADSLGVTVLLKGARTHVASPDGTRLVCESHVGWLATAGTGDALAGILGALVATNAQRATDPGGLAHLAAAASVLHSLAGERASGGGPLTVLDLAAAVPGVIAELLRG